MLVMKLTLMLTLFFALNAASAVYSQKTSLTLNLKSVTLEKVFDAIEKETGYSFFYNLDRIDLDKKITIQVNDKPITEVLNEILDFSRVDYRIIDNSIIIMQAKKVLEAKVQQKRITVTGKVMEKNGDPIAGVNVYDKDNPTKGVITSSDGSYSITVSSPDAILMYSFIGFDSQEIHVAGRREINVTLMESSIELGEVVSVGYSTQKKVNLTGSISTINVKEIGNIPNSNLSNSLAGRASGVQIIGNSGLAGASSSIRLRGSFSEPLYVINGIIKSKEEFDSLNPDEIESITFLKDAATAAIYGSKAGNGVVLVTTKQGKQQKAKFNFKGTYSTLRTTYPVQDYSATQELEYVNNMMITRGQDSPYGDEIFDYFKDKSYSINDLIWRNPNTQQYNLSVNGGNKHLTYYMALGYYSENGSYHNLNYDRLNIRSNVTAQLTKRSKIRLDISAYQRKRNRWYWPYDGAENYTVSDWYRATFNWTRLYPFYTDEMGNPTNDPNDIPVKTPGGYHPPEIMLHGGYRHTTDRNFNALLRYELDLGSFVDGLTTSVQINAHAYDSNMKSFVVHNKWYIFQHGSETNKFVPGPVDFSKTGMHNLSNPYENIQESVKLSGSYQLNWFVNYNKTFGKNEVTALAVYEQAWNQGKNLWGTAQQFLTPAIDQIYNTSSDTERRYFTGNEFESAWASWIGRANYSYASKYIVEFSFRYDGNYKFAPDNRWGFFPSISAAWRLSEEKFMDVNWLSNLKIRGSYGTTGSDNGIGPWRWTNYYQKSGGYVFGTSLKDGLRPGAMPNPDITWATFSNWNLGFDFGLFNNRLRGSFDYWQKVESDILGSRSASVPSTLGAQLPAVNYAQRSWKGTETSLTWSSKIGKVNYSIYTNIGFAIDQWDIIDEPESFTDGTYKDNWRSRIGKPANRVYGLISEGIIRTQEQLDALPKDYTVYGRTPQIGTILFKDIRGENFSDGADGKIDNYDMTYLSDNGAPRINYGFGLIVDWKGLSVDLHFQGVGAYDRMISTRNGGGVFQVDRPYFELWASNYWTPSNPDAKYPRVAGQWKKAEYGGLPSSFWLRNGAYMRLKNVNMAYTLPQRWFTKTGIEELSLFVNGTNLFVVTSMHEHDPEQATLDSYPLMRSFTGGISINF
jgi:TonB-linked SusC/RagA family outer membrane protein